MVPKKIAILLAVTLASVLLFSVALNNIPYEIGIHIVSKVGAGIAGILGLGMALGAYPEAFGMKPCRMTFKAISVIGSIATGFSVAACTLGYTGYGYEVAATIDLIAFCCVSISKLNA